MTVSDIILDVITVCHKFWFPNASTHLLCSLVPGKGSVCPAEPPCVHSRSAGIPKQPFFVAFVVTTGEGPGRVTLPLESIAGPRCPLGRLW